MQVDVTHLWTAVAAAIVAFSFVFKSAIATMFDSVVFLFVVHAFDVGDGILINGDLHKVGVCLTCRNLLPLVSGLAFCLLPVHLFLFPFKLVNLPIICSSICWRSFISKMRKALHDISNAAARLVKHSICSFYL